MLQAIKLIAGKSFAFETASHLPLDNSYIHTFHMITQPSVLIDAGADLSHYLVRSTLKLFSYTLVNEAKKLE